MGRGDPTPASRPVGAGIGAGRILDGHQPDASARRRGRHRLGAGLGRLGPFYEMTGERRTIGLGEEPLFFPHEAAQFAGRPEMPERFLSFHNGHASLFEYYHGPERKVYTDPRLEVAGAELFERYSDLEKAI